MKTLRLAGVVFAFAAVALALLAAPATSRAATLDKHLFDPVLSLEGDCNGEDGVADPGCPYQPPPLGPRPLANPCGTATDRHGDIYVANLGPIVEGGYSAAGEVDIFDPQGRFLTRIPNEHRPCQIAVDSQGNVYVVEEQQQLNEAGIRMAFLDRYKPDSYPPTATTEYTLGARFQFIVQEPGKADVPCAIPRAVAVDPSNDHLYIAKACYIEEYGSAAEGSQPDGIDEVQRLTVDASGGSLKLAFFPSSAVDFTADLSAGSHALTSILGAAGTGTLTAGSTAVTSLTTTSGAFKVGRPVSGPGIPEGIGTGDLSVGSSTVANVSTTSGAFAVGQTVFAAGVPGGTTITAVGAGTLTLSNAVEATGSGSAVALIANTIIVEATRGGASGFLRLSLPASASGTAVGLTSKGIAEHGLLRVFGRGVPPGAAIFSAGSGELSRGTGVLIGTTGKGDLSAGSATVANVSTTSGAFAVGQTLVAAGVPAGTTITAVGAGTLTLSSAATETRTGATLRASTNATASGAALPLAAGAEPEETTAIPYDASAATVQAALEALPGIGTGNVSVSGGPGGPGAASPYLIAFQGELANADVPQLGAESAGLTGGLAAATLTTETPGFDGLIGEGAAGPIDTSFRAVDVYGANHDIYVVNRRNNQPITTSVYVFDGASGETKCHLRGAGVAPFPEFDFSISGAIAVDQADGELYVYDLQHGVVDQFELGGAGGEGCAAYSFAGQLPPPSTEPNPAVSRNTDIAVDGSSQSPNEGEAYITVGSKDSNSHLYAFRPRNIGPPEVEEQEASGIGTSGAVLRARLNPGALQTSYRFEYTTEAAFKEHGYEGAGIVPVPDADAGAGASFVAVAAQATGLQPGTAYRFRLVASNCAAEEAIEGECLTLGEGNPGGVGEDASFATYPTPPPSARAYELVTPPDTGAHIPTMSMLGDEFSFVGFPTDMASPDGDGLLFGSRSGALPNLGGGGYQDVYEALRDPETGWQSHLAGLTGVQAQAPRSGGYSPDHGYAFWNAKKGDSGALIGGGAEEERYLTTPAGTPHSPNCAAPNDPEGRVEWIACGSLGVDPPAKGKWISKDAGHVVFESAAHLEGCAPPAGTNAIYDRTPGGPTRCVSLLPGGATPVAGANYRGTSADGSTVAFSIGPVLYVRRDGETLEVAAGNPTFGGLSRNGTRLFYTTGGTFGGGDIFAFDTESGAAQVGSGGESTLAYVSPDGSHAYFVSPLQLDGAEGQAGADNLYAWNGAAVHFIAVLDPLDLTGEGLGGRGLARWLRDAATAAFLSESGPANVTARSTPEGSAFLFESEAPLAGHEADGQRQIYRYAEGAPPAQRLLCISCNPTGAPAGTSAELESPPAGSSIDQFPPTSALTEIANVTADGNRAFFQSAERLVSADLDGRQDVYEWRAQGEEGCVRPAGCLVLISSPHSSGAEYLWAMSADGRDVFFLSGDTLLPADPDVTPSIYDARLGGGIPEAPPPPGPCLGEACQPAVSAPQAGTIVTSGEKPGNITSAPKRRCPKGKRKVRRAGKIRCLSRHRKKRGHHRPRHQKKTNANRRAAR